MSLQQTAHQTMQQTTTPYSLLVKALLANAAFSATSAALIALTHGRLAIEIALPSVYWLIIAMGLGLFALQLLVMAYGLINQRPWQGWVIKLTPSVVVADIIWVLGSLLLAGLFAEHISAIGLLLIGGVNVFVGSLAWLQYRGLQSGPR